ncbi:putative lysine-specific demethylase JMJ16 isoform X1 [Cynara cardunculus var. scolymus]|uniref:putative lysine-specific demethylase JMJ16 isoform X1 n=1 Tax=Cynara cardunculus var. scolymus TaxID=59895 RepID=UPI000D62B51F|nr:putative lysine-specific demethylase JMJ16 isoform X1 [Cynara cardunculus var. scolymus]
MPSENKRTKRIDTDEQSNPPAFVSLTSFLLKRVEGNEERGSTQVKPSSQAFDIEKLQKSLKRRPWILHDQINRSEKLDREHLDKNSCVENSPPKGVIHGCSSCNDCQKVTAHWRPEESNKLELDCAPVFHPTEEEFEDTSKYIAKIRPEAEEYGICSIVPPDSWQPYCPIKENKIWENSRFHTHVQRIDELQNPYLKRERRKITEKMNGNRTSMVELNNGSDGFQLESGPDFTLQTFKTYAEDFEACYFQKEGILMDSGTPTWEDIEGEYWRIVQNPTEEIQVLCGHNLEANVLGSGFPLPSDSLGEDQTKYIKSGWNLNNTAKLPGSLLASESYDGSAALAPRMDVGMCFSSFCWKVEEHNLYSLSYLPLGASRIWYAIPGRYYSKCEAALKKTFPQLLGHPKLFHKLVTQLSPSILNSEGIPVYRCFQYPHQFVLVFPGAYSSGFNIGFNVSMSVNLAPFDWLPYGEYSVEIYKDLHRKTSISYDKLLIDISRNTVKASWLLKLRRDSEEWKTACGTDGWLTRALKSRVKRESLRREFLCTASQSRMMEKEFGSTVKKECIVCYYDLYLSATACLCSLDRYTCLEHSKQLCSCPWSSRMFLFRYNIDELNLLIEALEGKLNALYRWAEENREIFSNDRDDK